MSLTIPLWAESLIHLSFLFSDWTFSARGSRFSFWVALLHQHLKQRFAEYRTTVGQSLPFLSDLMTPFYRLNKSMSPNFCYFGMVNQRCECLFVLFLVEASKSRSSMENKHCENPGFVLASWLRSRTYLTKTCFWRTLSAELLFIETRNSIRFEWWLLLSSIWSKTDLLLNCYWVNVKFTVCGLPSTFTSSLCPPNE